MKTSKIILASVLFLTFVVFVVNCDRRNQEPKTFRSKHLSVLFVQSWGDAVNDEFKRICNEWTKQSGTVVDLEIIPIKELDIKMTAWVNSPSGDLALLPTNMAMVNTSKLQDVSPLAEELRKVSLGFYTIGEKMGSLEGRWYNVPFCAWPHVWFYRKDLMQSVNLGIPRTYDDAERLFTAIKRKHPDIFPLGQGLGQDEDISVFLQTLIWAYGGSVVGSDGRTVTVDSPEVKSAFNYMLHLYRAGLMPPGALSWDGASNNNAFLSKTVAVTANALSIDYTAKRRDPELFSNILHSAYPAGPAGQFTFVQSFAWAIKAQSTNRAEADSFLKYIYEVKTLQHLFAVGEGAIAPLSRSVGDTVEWRNGRYADAIASVENARPLGWPGPFTRQAAEVYNKCILNRVFARVINDGYSVDRAVAEAAKEIQMIYNNTYGR